MSVLHVGIDIGSTTVKAVVLDHAHNLLHTSYSRHFADIRSSVKNLTNKLCEKYGDHEVTAALSGSGALALAENTEIPFAQELVACAAGIEQYLPHIDVAIELGGEDAKLTFFDPGGLDQRMNETCAGGTGAFLDQVASLMETDVAGLNELARDAGTIYPVASRCGVFAKTDIQALLNDGASRSDVAASVFQAVVNQTISGLACGRHISGNVAFLGGPLYFLSELRKCFAETLKLTPECLILPELPHLFVALGASLLAREATPQKLADLQKKIADFFTHQETRATSTLPPLFSGEKERNDFHQRHKQYRIVDRSLRDYRGDAFVGIDVGSTTTKVVLAGQNGELLFSRYLAGGDPLQAVRDTLLELYAELPEGVRIAGSGATGYGEQLISAAFSVDVGEVETVAHAKAADFVLPGTEFVIDIGGQDMKCLSIRNGMIRDVFLNEACSSGCGSFLQSFAESLGMTPTQFGEIAQTSGKPVDLGSRCTVFMNSRVRGAQKEGASIPDIAAGLACSVVKNALYKVLKIRDARELGSRIVVQGGTFKNDAVLRAFEQASGVQVVRPKMPELMGAFGAALLARERRTDRASSFISLEKLKEFSFISSTARCAGCGNRCVLTRTEFGDGRLHVSGNRCSKGAPRGERPNLPPNVFALKYARLFEHYRPLSAAEAFRGVIGIPRVLNMYENYPFWFTLFTSLGFRVELSSGNPDEHLGIDTIPSQTVCLPAKLAHRHLLDLLRHGITRIFYPGIQKECTEFHNAHNHFNCPVLTGYPDVAYLNIDELRAPGVEFLHPFLPLHSPEAMRRQMKEELSSWSIPAVGREELRRALEAAYAEQDAFKETVRGYGAKTLEYLKTNKCLGVVLAGHPYHLDPQVHHGIPELINEYGVAVLTEDSICDEGTPLLETRKMYVIDQWVYHSRLYRAAAAVCAHPELQLVQLNSFGCGLDAISADQTASLLESNGKIHTLLKIDEGKNVGAARIRIRSMLAAIHHGAGISEPAPAPAPRTAPRTREVRTILCPPLSPHHFQFLGGALSCDDYNFVVLPEGGRDVVELGLKYVNNDACYPAMVVVGQFLHAFKSGAYDPDSTDCFYAQTGGACRASNYVPLLRRALDAAGYQQVGIWAANAQKDGQAKSFPLSKRAVWRSLLALSYGDLLMRLLLRTRPYEYIKGSAESLYKDWVERCQSNVARGSWKIFKSHVNDMIQAFSALKILQDPKPRVGIVGEILVKYHAGANEQLVTLIEEEGGEAVVPDLSSFLMYCLFDRVYASKNLDGGFGAGILGRAGIFMLERMLDPVKKALRFSRFGKVHDFYRMTQKADTMVSLANQAGEGWLLTAEMIALLENGVRNILCIQPFACLPNHITGKGVLKELKRRFRDANILALDYDSSVSTVNQLNRIKLLMAGARSRI